MALATPLPNLEVNVDCGGPLCETEDGRQFLQQRLAFFGGLSLLFCTGLFFAFNLLQTLTAEQPLSHWVTDRANQVHLGSCLVFALIWQVCRRGRIRRPMLATIDLVGVLIVAITIGMTYTPETLMKYRDHNGLAALAVTLFARSFIVPSRPRQTFVIGLLAALPLIFAYHSGLSRVDGDRFVGPSVSFSTSTLAIWCVVIVLTATVSSWIVYGLQNRVREAKQLGQYTLDYRIGRGGMGEVYRARHALLRRPTAVKILQADKAGARNLARFEREVQLTSLLTHPNTIAIYDYGHSPDGTFYYAMEFLEGLDLEDLVKHDGPLPPGRVIHILRQIASSLVEAHENQLIHRDIKPANIILCERGGQSDFVKVLDFGLVKSLDPAEDTGVSVANTITGSPLYLSPESIGKPSEVDGRSDIYSVGAVGYFLLTGKHLFDSTNVLEIIGHHLHTTPLPPSRRLDGAVPEDLERVLLSCLEKEREKRPADARRLLEELADCQDANHWTSGDAEDWWRQRGKDIRERVQAETPPEPTIGTIEPTGALEIRPSIDSTADTLVAP